MTVTVALSTLFVSFQSVSLAVTLATLVNVPTTFARELITKVSSVPLPMNPIVQTPSV